MKCVSKIISFEKMKTRLFWIRRCRVRFISTSVAGPSEQQITYKTHHPITNFQRIGLTFISAISALNNPAKADMVAILGETTGHSALKRLHAKMLEVPEGREILKERPEIQDVSVDFLQLGKLPSGSFGKKYAEFMLRHSFNPDSRMPVRFVDDPDLAYVMLRYRQVHDLWHVLSGLAPSLEGEIALKWFEMAQTGLPMTTLSAVFGAIKIPREKRENLLQHYIPWALRAGRNAVPLLNVWYEKKWEMQISDLRKELKFEPAPLIK